MNDEDGARRNWILNIVLELRMFCERAGSAIDSVSYNQSGSAAVVGSN